MLDNNSEHNSAVVIGDDHQVQTRLTRNPELKPCVQILSPVLIMMKVAGQFHEPVGRPIRCNVSFAFCILILCLMLFEMCRMFFIYEKTDGFISRMFKVLMHCILVQEVLGNLIFLARIAPWMRCFFKDYDRYRADTEFVNDDDRMRRGIVRTVALFCLLVGPTRVVFSILTVVYPSTAYNYLRPYYQGPPDNVPYSMASIFAAVRLFYSYNDAIGIACLLALCYLLGKEFDLLTSRLQKSSREEWQEGPSSQNLSGVRQNYLQLCSLVNTLDGAFGPFMLVTCIMDLLNIALHVLPLMMERPVLQGRPGLSTLVVLVSAMDRWCHLGGLFYAGIRLTTKSKGIQALLMKMDVASLSRNSFQEVQMLLMKVVYEPVGLSAWGFIQISKPFIVTVLSIGLTYTVVLGKFGLRFGDKPAIIALNSTTYN